MINENDIDFENALLRLEKIAQELESGKAQLDDSLKLFEEGIELSRICKKKLDEAEQKVKILTGTEN